MTLKIAIVGLPNVGKSTLFNRLVGKKHAIVEDTPGVTRDRREGKANIGPMEFIAIDTAGLEEAENDAIEAKMVEQTEIAVIQSDLILFVVDGRLGVTNHDKFFANWLRKKNKPIRLIVNKSEGKHGNENISDFYGLGFGEPTFISAAHGEGMAELYDTIEPFYDEEKHQLEEESEEKFLKIAIIGRPNAGKSTLVNKLIKENRMITGEQAGITRDSIAINWEYKTKLIQLIDTAGLRKKGKVASKLEKLSNEDSLRAIQFAHIVVLLIDANIPLEKQDIAIGTYALEEGRPLIIAINKWDSIKDKNAAVQEIREKVDKFFPQIKSVPVIYLSALLGTNVYNIIDASIESYDKWNKRISTAKLNDWLNYTVENHPLPLGKNGRRIRIKYITQSKTRPPTFLLFASQAEGIAETYLRYLNNSLREEFDFGSVPLRFSFKRNKNPYVKE